MIRETKYCYRCGTEYVITRNESDADELPLYCPFCGSTDIGDEPEEELEEQE